MRRLAAFVGSSIVTVALGLSVALPLSFAQNANSKIEQSTQVFSTDFSHSESASSGSVTLTASWNDPQLGSPTTFHVEGTGGSGKYLFRMELSQILVYAFAWRKQRIDFPELRNSVRIRIFVRYFFKHQIH